MAPQAQTNTGFMIGNQPGAF